VPDWALSLKRAPSCGAEEELSALPRVKQAPRATATPGLRSAGGVSRSEATGVSKRLPTSEATTCATASCTRKHAQSRGKGVPGAPSIHNPWRHRRRKARRHRFLRARHPGTRARLPRIQHVLESSGSGAGTLRSGEARPASAARRGGAGRRGLGLRGPRGDRPPPARAAEQRRPGGSGGCAPGSAG
jgi:hypothetical protein